MNWKNPDVEIHVTGWPALIVMMALTLAFINTVLDFVSWLFR